MRASTKRILSIAISAILFIATLVVYSNLIRPEMSRVADKRDAVFSRAQVLESQTLAVSKVQGLASELQRTEELQNTVSLILPMDPEVTNVLNQLRAISISSRAQITSFSATHSPFQESGRSLVRRLGVLGVDVVVEGSYESVKGFLKALETNARVFNIESYSIGPMLLGSGSDAIDDFYSMSVTVEVYYQE